ncbi:glycoside hydrolase family 23 protein [Lentinula raphanica]|nr:glycoside hydrolase family 23 protein [Lentinula raphanica]KAJ3973714.1 glycoside hydrolase family 23 protein [Lentinula raphanica]
MRSHSFTFAFFCAAVTTVVASNSHELGARFHHARRAIHARNNPVMKRCKSRDGTTTSAGVDDAAQYSSSYAPSPTSSSASAHSSSAYSSSAAAPTQSSSATGTNSSTGSLLSVVSTCGDIGATLDITSQSGPNGNIYWLNCGVSDSGWNPTYVTIDELIVKDFATALQEANTPFSACSQYTDIFYEYGQQFGIPPIMIASFAMQESSCDASTVGGGGEQGLMQLTPDKCTDAPNGNCLDVDYNIKTGAQYFKTLLDSYNGDVLLSIGSYNGWYKGMTYDDATAAASTSCCRCQNNLDYLHQYLNGWIQNVNAYSDDLGVYHNLDVCSSD